MTKFSMCPWTAQQWCCALIIHSAIAVFVSSATYTTDFESLLTIWLTDVLQVKNGMYCTVRVVTLRGNYPNISLFRPLCLTYNRIRMQHSAIIIKVICSLYHTITRTWSFSVVHTYLQLLITTKRTLVNIIQSLTHTPYKTINAKNQLIRNYLF